MDQVKIRRRQINLSNHDRASMNYAGNIFVHLVMDERDGNFGIDYIDHHLYDIVSNIFNFQLRMKHHQDEQLRRWREDVRY